MEAKPTRNKALLSKPFVYKLYKTYEAAYSRASIQNGKTLAVIKVQEVTKLSRATVYKILKEAREKGAFTKPKIRRKRPRGVNHMLHEIKEKVILLSKRTDGYLPMRRIYGELIKDGLFKGSKGLLRTIMREMGFFYRKCNDRWQLILSDKNLPDVPIDLNQGAVNNISLSNMMEVKHSPAAQIEFRSAKNGLPDDEEDNFHFDGEIKKSKDGNRTSTLNGVLKQTESEEVEVTPETELYTDESDQESSAAEEPSSKSSTTGSKVRDTGKDLDTLLSKINDLVEDCVEVKPNKNDDKGIEIVEIDDDFDDESEADEKSDYIETKEKEKQKDPISKAASSNSAPASASASATTEESSSKKNILNVVLDTNDDIVCLDSPVPSTEQNNQQSNENHQKEGDSLKRQVPQSSGDSEPEKKIESSSKSPEAKEETKEMKETSQEDDDEIYLIEDDDEDAEMEKPTEQSKPPSNVHEDDKKEIVDEVKQEPPKSEVTVQPADKEKKTETCKDVPPPTSTTTEDDDIVCLDDSIEEESVKHSDETVKDPEVTTESTSETCASKKVDEPMDVEKPVEKSAEPLTETKPEVDEEKIKTTTEPAEEPQEDSMQNEKTVTKKSESPSDNVLDDDVVILDDDDEETGTVSIEKTSTSDSIKDEVPVSSSEPTAPIKEVDEKSSTETEEPEPVVPLKPSTIQPDNSDNARDGVEEKEEIAEEKSSKEETPLPSEDNSQSNSSNLLKASAEQEEPAEQPPAKRIRLSRDEESLASQEDSKSTNVDEIASADLSTEVKEDDTNKSLKRTHSNESLTSDSKKIKTIEEAASQDEKIKSEPEEKKVNVKPVPLYPPPKLDLPVIDLSLDFLKRFKKSLHKMTKSDLEELVLQKIVEVVVHKSEFSEMRELIEKQEKIISGHRTKITELNKQFRDLEMVHNRVLKDLETKNSQFIMPVKITRAVGLQVCFPNKKFDLPLIPLPVQTGQTSPASATRSATSSTVPNNAPESKPSHTNSPANSSSSTASAINKNAAAIANTQQQSSTQRRGCVQKLTPMRPDTPRNSPLNRAAVTAVVASTSASSPIPTTKDTPPKILNRSIGQKKTLTPSAASTASTGLLPIAPHSAPVATPPSIATKKVSGQTRYLGEPLTYKNKQKLNTNGAQLKACPSDVPSSVAHQMAAAETTVAPQVPYNPTVIAQPPNPPSKSVIDLTDEDDVLPPVVANSPRTPMSATVAIVATLPPAPAPVMHQSPMTNTVAANRSKAYAIAQQQLQQLQKANPPKQTPLRTPVPIAPKPNGLAIAVRQIPSNTNRYRHPAPLPNQPVQTSNPAWKLPPARPTIRISNLESGIVISWTIEDTAKDKYAESTSYQIYAYQETSGPPLVESWRHVGDVKAMLLPMAVTLTQFQEGQRYYFAVRAVDAYNRCGPFSFAKTWS